MAWTTPRTWVAGEVVTASLLNTHVRDNLNAVSGIWQNYTPTFTGGISAGNGVVSGSYAQVGKIATFHAKIVTGTTTTYPGGAISVSLPLAGVSNAFEVLVRFNDISGNFYFGNGIATGSTASCYVAGTNGAAASMSSTVPFTWATGDEITVSGTYWVA
jgi:hypothetical protein